MAWKEKLYRAICYIIRGVPTQYVTAEVSYSAPHQLLVNKKIIITGGGRGLGYAMAKKFISEGAAVLIAGQTKRR